MSSERDQSMQPVPPDSLMTCTYDSTGRVTSVQDGPGRTWHYPYTGPGVLSAPPTARPDAAPAAAGPASGAVTLADIETKLLETAAPTPAELTSLMQDRANRVRDYLVKNGKVAPDRLTVAPPKPPDKSATGQPRVTLSLE